MRRDFDDEDDDDLEEEEENPDIINIVDDEESLMIEGMSEEAIAELVFDSFENIYDGLDALAEVLEYFYVKNKEYNESKDSEVLILTEKCRGYEAELKRLYQQLAKYTSEEEQSKE
jgi:hypothetical protein